jgi:hemerythrin superfamily protein
MPNRLDSVIAKTAGATKAVKARLDGLVGVFTTLAEQHGEVSALLHRLQRKPDEKSELWPEIRRELISHERAELREVYPVLRQHEQLRTLADEHDREAGELDDMIDELETAPLDEWMPLFDQLVDTVIHHAQQEEQRIFPAALQVIGHDTAKQLDAKFLAAKKQIAQAT